MAAKETLEYPAKVLAIWLTAFKRPRKLTVKMQMNRLQALFSHGLSNTIEDELGSQQLADDLGVLIFLAVRM